LKGHVFEIVVGKQRGIFREAEDASEDFIKILFEKYKQVLTCVLDWTQCYLDTI